LLKVSVDIIERRRRHVTTWLAADWTVELMAVDVNISAVPVLVEHTAFTCQCRLYDCSQFTAIDKPDTIRPIHRASYMCTTKQTNSNKTHSTIKVQDTGSSADAERPRDALCH